MTRLAPLVALLAAVACAATPSAGAAQREISLEANPVHGTVGYGWATDGGRLIGVQVGFGFPQLDRTLVPGGESLIDFLHIGLFMRAQPFRSVALEGGIRTGLAELRGCSGCLPGLLTSVSGAAFWGGRHVKVGPRLTAGAIREGGEPTTFVLNLTPLAALFTYTW